MRDHDYGPASGPADFDITKALNSALSAGSDAIAETTRPRAPEAVRARGDQRRRRQALASALAVLLVVGGAGGAAYAGLAAHREQAPITHRVTPSPHPTRHTASPPAQHQRSHHHAHAAAPLTAGQTGSRSAVPWSQVGPGWTLAETATGPAYSSGQWQGGGELTVDLLDPAGGRYVIYQQAGTPPAAWTVLDWSGSGRVALLGAASAGQPPDNEFRVLNLQTGAVSTLPLPANVAPAGLTQPDGTNVLAVEQQSARTIRLQRYSLAGVLQATLASEVVPAGSPAASGCGQLCGAVSSPDGTTVAWSAGGSLELVGNAGGVPRKLPVPGTGADPACAPVRWWNDGTLLASCPQGRMNRLWLVPADGAAPAPLAAATVASQTAAWMAAGAPYITRAVASSCPGSTAGLEGSGISLAAAGGSLRPVAVPGAAGDASSVEGALGTRLLVLARTSCSGPDELLWLDPVTGASQTLLSAPAGQAGVVTALPFDG
jgi:TolB protein